MATACSLSIKIRSDWRVVWNFSPCRFPDFLTLVIFIYGKRILRLRKKCLKLKIRDCYCKISSWYILDVLFGLWRRFFWMVIHVLIIKDWKLTYKFKKKYPPNAWLYEVVFIFVASKLQKWQLMHTWCLIGEVNTLLMRGISCFSHKG